jgi:hypothetical protein
MLGGIISCVLLFKAIQLDSDRLFTKSTLLKNM